MCGRIIVYLLVIYSGLLCAKEETKISYYRPYAKTNKHPEPFITATHIGKCNLQSARIKRKDAWHCKSEDGLIYDPCFSKRFGSTSTVICPRTPWSANSIQLTLTTPLDNRFHVGLDMSRTAPWAIALSTGERCMSIKSTAQMDGLQVTYQCKEGGVLLGEVQRCATTWSILKHDNLGLSMVEIANAWF